MQGRSEVLVSPGLPCHAHKLAGGAPRAGGAGDGGSSWREGAGSGVSRYGHCESYFIHIVDSQCIDTPTLKGTILFNLFWLPMMGFMTSLDTLASQVLLIVALKLLMLECLIRCVAGVWRWRFACSRRVGAEMYGVYSAAVPTSVGRILLLRFLN